MDTHTARLRLAEDVGRLAQGLPGDIAAHARERYGIDLTGRYAGRPIRIPFGKASGQLSMTAGQVEADAAAGLGFVVLKTVIAQDERGASTMSEWAIHETAMAVEQRASASGRQGWTVTWNGRGWDRSFADYVTLYRRALAIGAEHGMPVAASVKYHLPPLHQDFAIAEYEHTTRSLAQVGGAATIIEKDFSPTLAGDQRARAQEAILRWLRDVPGLIRRTAAVTLGLKLMNAMFDDEFQVAMVATACASSADFLVLFNRLFDADRKVAYGGWDLSDRNLRVLDRLRGIVGSGDSGMEKTREAFSIPPSRYPTIPRLLPISATGNITSGRLLVEYARRGATSGQLHTFFQLPAESYAARLENRIASALFTLLYEPRDGLIAAMLDLADRGVLQPRGGLLHFLDIGDGARSAA